MNAEKIQDAMSWLDDDLIEQTDALRQGKRVLRTRPTAGQMLRWAAPAACLVLLLGAGAMVGPREAGGSSDHMEVEMNEAQNGAPGEWLQDQENQGAEESRYHSQTGWQTVSCGDLSLEIPGNWTHELVIADDGSYFIRFRPPHETGSVQVGYWPDFGVCGTGLTEEKTVVAGMEANAGYYDGGKQWSFITFRVEERLYVVTKDGAESWWGVHGETAMQILDTLVIDEKE